MKQRNNRREIPADIDNTKTWIKYNKKLCQSCRGACCSMPVEVGGEDLVRLGLADIFELDDDHKFIARRLKKEGLVEHYHAGSQVFTLARLANGDCVYLDQKSRLCTTYQKRPETCRNHPHVGPRPGYCAFTPKN